MSSQVASYPAFPGFPAPPMKALAYRNGRIIDYDLQKEKGKTTLVLFSPVDFDYISPTEVRSAEQLAPGLDVQLVLVSPGSVNSKAAWASTPRQQGGLQGTSFTLVGDLDRSISLAYGMLNTRTGHNCRGIVTITPDLVISYRAVADLPIGLGVAAAMRHVSAVRAGITPPDWQPCQPGTPDRSQSTFTKDFASPLDPLDPTAHAVAGMDDGEMGEDTSEGNRQESEKGAAILTDAVGQTEPAAAGIAPQLTANGAAAPGDLTTAGLETTEGAASPDTAADSSAQAGDGGGEAGMDVPVADRRRVVELCGCGLPYVHSTLHHKIAETSPTTSPTTTTTTTT